MQEIILSADEAVAGVGNPGGKRAAGGKTKKEKK